MLYAFSPFPCKPGHNRLSAALASLHMNILKRYECRCVDDQIIINDCKQFMIMIFVAHWLRMYASNSPLTE